MAEHDAPDLAVAQARMRAAQGIAEQAGAALRPAVGADASAGLAKQSYNNGIPPEFVPHGWQDIGQAQISLNWSLDFWGRNRAALAAATSDTKAAGIEVAQARLLLATGITGAYVDLAGLYADRDVAERAVAVRQDSFRLVGQRATNGLDNQAEYKQAESRLASARADLAAIDETIGIARNRIAALAGQGPDFGQSITRPQLDAPAAFTLPGRTGIDIIGRRPDIAAARLRAQAAASRTKAARAAFYPNISLGALIGLQSLGLSNLVESGSTMGNIGPAISLPIFQGGRLSGQFRQARAEYDEAVANYDATLLHALNEVADSATSLRALEVRRREASHALAAAEQAYALAEQRYRGGLSTYLDVLVSEDALLASRRAMADLDSRAYTLNVMLVRALGGGFSVT